MTEQQQLLGNKFTDNVRSVQFVPDVATQNFINAEKQAQLDNYNQNREERKKYADCIYTFTCFWCLFVGSLIILTGLRKLVLSDVILTTLLGSTTLNVFGFFYLVTQYLFNKDKST